VGLPISEQLHVLVYELAVVDGCVYYQARCDRLQEVQGPHTGIGEGLGSRLCFTEDVVLL
jgi:hypothetical protein